ncbi:MAG: S24 family peptidase [Flavobacteriaceae bacterium]|nr:S24 family peptidase [Flavobacteriaceae bacterium]MCY4217285.1 S24 family peptidase [Flavobacteriaceae bacterium]MCY4253990.1 S24 family peptidase [Flavobacteriaceae bacterium]
MKIKKRPPLGKELISMPFRIEDQKIYVKYYQEGVQAGFPSAADDFQEMPLSLDEKYLKDPKATYLIRVVGHSMHPTLHKNDILIVKSNLSFRDGAIGIVSVNHTDFTVKRLDEKGHRLMADNKNFSPINIKKEDTIICLGVVKHLIRDL